MRRTISAFGFPQSGDVSSVAGLGGSWNRDAAYTLGQEGSPSVLAGMGFAFRRGNNASPNYVTQAFQQGGLTPTISSTLALEHVRMRIRRYPTVEEQFWSQTNTSAGSFYLGTINAAGDLRFYNCAGTFPGTFLCGLSTLPLNTWFQLVLRVSAVPAGGGGVPGASFVFEVLNPSYASSVSGALSFPPNQSFLGAEGRVAVNNGLEIDFTDWVIDDLGNPPSALEIDGIHGKLVAERTADAGLTTLTRVEVRRPQGLGTYQNWTTSGILAYQARQGIPPDSTPGGGINILTSNVSGAKVSYSFGSLTTMAIAGAVRALRLAVYYASGSGTHQLIFRRGSAEILFPVTAGANTWASVVLDTTDLAIFPPAGLDPSDLLEVGVQKDATGNSASIQSVLLEVESDANPIPGQLVTPTDNTIRIAWGQYLGNGTAQAITVGFVPEWVSVLPIIGASGDGLLWFDADVGAPGHTDSRVIGTRLCSLQANGFTVAGTDALCNQAGITYQWVALRDPQQRACCRGTITHGTTDTSAVNVLAGGFTPLALWAKLLKWAASVGTGSSFYRGPGHTATFASPLAAAQSATIVTALGAGSFTSSTDLHQPGSGNVGTTYAAWRSDTFSGSRKWHATSYTGDGTGARTVAIDLGGHAPLWALLVSHDGASYLRVPSMACGQSYLFGTSTLSLSTNGLTGGGIDVVTVAAASNTLGVIYDLFAIAGLSALDPCGWAVSPAPGEAPIGTVDLPPPTPLPAGCLIPQPAAEGGTICVLPYF